MALTPGLGRLNVGIPTKEEKQARGATWLLRRPSGRRGLMCPAHLLGVQAAMRLGTPILFQPRPLEGLSVAHPCSVYALCRTLGAGQGVRRRGSF